MWREIYLLVGLEGALGHSYTRLGKFTLVDILMNLSFKYVEPIWIVVSIAWHD